MVREVDRKKSMACQEARGINLWKIFLGEGFKIHNFTVGGPCEFVRRG